MKKGILFLIILCAITINSIGCSNNTENNLPVISQTNQSQINESKTTQNESNNNDFNKFFYKDIALKNHYTYKGTIWGDNILDRDKENLDSDGGVYVIANLTISQIAKLSKGNIYKLDFSIKEEKNNTEKKGEKVFLWVTEDRIYNLSPPSATYDNDDIDENGEFNDLKYVKKILKSGQLPSTDKEEILCSNENINFNDGSWETKILVKNNSCTYDSSNDRNESYKSIVWEVGKGIKSYSWGQGAGKAGMNLHLVE